MTLRHELRVALDLARRCGTIALDYQRRGTASLEVRDKGLGQGLVTRADTELNTAIVTALHAAFPGDAIVAEESPERVASERRRAERCWQVDPIDGTSSYARLEDSWAIHIGLIIDGEPALGVVAEPARGRISWGIDHGRVREAWGEKTGAAARRLERRPVSLDALRLISSRNHASPKIHEIMQALAIPPERSLRISSTGVKVMTVAWGESDLYVHPRAGTKLWDTAAPHAVLRAAGGVLSDLRGEPLPYRGPSLGNDAGLIACGASEHRQLCDRLSQSADVWLTVT